MKLATKVMTNRLKQLLKELVSPNQASFVPGRQSLDNYVICQEVVDTLRYTTARHGGMIVKIDLDKAYDMLEWSFVEGTVRDIALPEKIIDVIMSLLHRSSFKILFNGEITERIKTRHDLRQGDPLSPYLFILCLECLGHWIQHKVDVVVWRPLRASWGGMRISHLFFADDLLLFVEGIVEQALCIRDSLDGFYRASGQKVSFNKLMLFVSPNMDKQTADELCLKLEIPLIEELGRYLGHNLIHKGRNGAM